MRRHRKLLLFSILVLVGLGYVVIAYRRPLPPVEAINLAQTPVVYHAPTLSWPTYGESAVGAMGYGVLATHGTTSEIPTASVTKMMTTLAILKRYPLAVGQQGPTITLTDKDVALYNTYLAQGGSVVKVVSGEKITEYQALEAMLSPSANNMADTLAIWAYGSTANYVTTANQMAKSMGLTDSYFSDASGFAPETVSTAHDLVLLGENAITNPVIAQIVAQKSATVPIAGAVQNVNWLLGSHGINGIKTGSTGQAGGVYLFSAQETLVNSQPITVVGAIMGAPTLQKALDDAIPLLGSVSANFQPTTVVRANEVVGYYDPEWGSRIEAVVSKTLAPVTWPDERLTTSVHFSPLHTPLVPGAQVGTVIVSGTTTESSPVVTEQALSSPPWYWRLFHV